MKILTVIGARPQFIKASALSRVLLETNNIKEVIVHTGQHYDHNMSDIFFSEMNIPRPDYFLNVNGLGHGAMTGQMLEKIEEVLLNEKPDRVVVYGDTNSTLAGGLAAAKLNIPVAHIEAGLRSFNMQMPEEVNRILTDRISSQLYCPTDTAVNNLRNEGFENFQCEIERTGDVMYDAALFYSDQADKKSNIINNLGLSDKPYLLATIHRSENTDDPARLTQIIKAINILSQKYQVILPLHPRTKKMIKNVNLNLECTIIDPVGYFDMLQLIKNSHLVLTDSGGLQKEAYFFNKYCVTFRDQTEWIELVEGNYNILTGTSIDKILSAVEKFMNQEFNNNSDKLYGDGMASVLICKSLVS